MRVQSVSNLYYQAKTAKKKVQNNRAIVPQLNFNGAGGAVKGALAGGGAAALLGLLTPFGWTILPLWAIGGAIAGSASEEDDKENEKPNS